MASIPNEFYAELRASKAELIALRDGIRDLEVYLTSDKFTAPGERYVAVGDVLARLANAYGQATDAYRAVKEDMR